MRKKISTTHRRNIGPRLSEKNTNAIARIEKPEVKSRPLNADAMNIERSASMNITYDKGL
jgi:hypothetical protein